MSAHVPGPMRAHAPGPEGAHAPGPEGASVPGPEGASVPGPEGARLGPVSDIPLGEGRAYAVGGESIAVFRLRDGTLRAVSAVCPHRGGPLADGQVDNRLVVCPLHLNAFDLATGCALGDSGVPDLTVYPVGVDADQHIVIHSEVPA